MSTHHPSGSTFERVKKHAEEGCPKPSIVGTLFSRNLGGISAGMGSANSTFASWRRSGRACFIVAAKLDVVLKEYLVILLKNSLLC